MYSLWMGIAREQPSLIKPLQTVKSNKYKSMNTLNFEKPKKQTQQNRLKDSLLQHSN